MKYRIKKETKIISHVPSNLEDKEITYFPQYKSFLFWYNFKIKHPDFSGGYWYEDVTFKNKDEALIFINEKKKIKETRVFVKDKIVEYLYL